MDVGIDTSKPPPGCQGVCSGSAMTGWQLETSSPGPVTSGGGARGWPGVSSCQQSASNQPQPTPVIFFNLPPTIGQWSSPTLTLIYIDIPYVFKHPFVIVFSHVLVYISEYSEYQCTMYNEQLYIDVEIGVLYMAAVRSVKGYLVTQLAPRDPLSVCQHTPIPGVLKPPTHCNTALTQS